MTRRRKRVTARFLVPFNWRIIVRILLVAVGIGLMGILITGWILYGKFRVYTDVPFGVLLMREDPLESEEALVVIHVFPHARRGLVTYVPQDLLIHLYGGYGEYQARAIKPLRDLEELPNQLIVESVAVTMQMPVTMGITVPSTMRLADKGWPLSKSALLGQLLWSSASLEDRAYLLQLILIYNQVQHYTWQTVDADLTRYMEVAQLEGRRLNPQLWGRYLDEKVTPALRWEGEVEVVVVNTTGISGLAEGYGNIVRHSGWRVIGLFDAPVKQTEVLLANEMATRRYRINRFIINNLLYKADIREGETEDYRAGVVIYLGEEVKSRYTSLKGYR